MKGSSIGVATMAGLVLAVASAASGGYVDIVLGDNPTAYWRLDESTGNFVSTINGTHAGSDAGHLVARGINGPQPSAFPGFDSANKGILASNTPGGVGATSYVSVPHNEAFDAGLDNWSIEAWVYLTETQSTGEGYFVSKMNGSRDGYGLSLSSANKFGVTFRETSGNGGGSYPILG